MNGSDFKVWEIEVDAIRQSGLYNETIITQAIRGALKGSTRRILLTIDPGVSSVEILSKLEDIYDNMQTEVSIMQVFYNALQSENETTSEWAIRLESIMVLAIEKGEVTIDKRNHILKQRFWKGLRNETLKNNSE